MTTRPTPRRYQILAIDRDGRDVWWFTTAYDATDALTQWEVERRLTLHWVGGVMVPDRSEARRIEPSL